MKARWVLLAGILIGLVVGGGSVFAYQALSVPRTRVAAIASPAPSPSPQTYPAPSPAGPVGRAGAGLAFDPVRDHLIMFGGYNTKLLSDTWSWDGKAWSQLTSVHHPPGRELPQLVYDSAGRRILMHGGLQGPLGVGSYANDWWAWDGTDWSQIAPSGGPGSVNWEVMADDPAVGGVLVLASVGSPNPKAETWVLRGDGLSRLADGPDEFRDVSLMRFHEASKQMVLVTYTPTRVFTETFDGTVWTQVSGSLPTWPHAIAEDPARGNLLLFGGNLDTWTWDGIRWDVRNPATSPTTRGVVSMGYDATRKLVVLFGGSSGQTTFLADTWIWDGSNWKAAA